ncbi:MAG: glycoside hydrolase family 95 protein [Firmicutes bacterium]|nr:glycoside hydrolase family 95 protein [Bacillota bacterium]
MSRLWYEQPAAEWEEALPIGSGRLGAMVYGGTDAEQLQLNEESIWYGGRVDRINPDFKRNLPLIREYLDQGQIAKAERLMDKAMTGCPDSMHPYQTLGEIAFKFYGIDRENVTAYTRTLDLDRAVARTQFRVGETLYCREIFASHPADCIIMRFTADGPGTVDFTARMRRGKFFDGVRRYGDDAVELYGNLGRGGYEFSMMLQAEAVGQGKVTALGESLDAAGAKEVILYFTADTTYHYGIQEQNAWVANFKEKFAEKGFSLPVDGETAVKNRTSPSFCPAAAHYLGLAQRQDIPEYERLEYLTQAALQTLLHNNLTARIQRASEKKYQGLLAEHIADHSALYDRFAFELEGVEAFDSLPTDKRLEQAKEGRADVGLSKLLFDFGRYLTISCSREGGLPSTLQGLWNKDFTPPWDSKYTININTEMNYWHVESCNLSRCHMPLFDLLEKVQITGRRTAREMYGCRGFVAHHNTDVHGDSAPQDIWYPGSYWTMGAAWLATHLWTHYQYTLDETFLKRAFPVLAEAALFFVDFLIERNGYLVTSPSVSPENSYRLPNGEKGSCCVGATMDNQILRHLFTGCLGAWEALGEKEPEGCEIADVESIPELMEQIRNCRDRLTPTQISDSGRIMEWQQDHEEVEPGHRHISHLYGLYPGGEITVDGTPKLAAAARKTLEYRLSHGGGHTGWSRAWIMNHYASLWDGEAAYENIEKMLGQSTYPNMFDRHPPFQIDGNFGACAAMSGMLAQSSLGRAVLLPALPKAWKAGSVRGLRLAGNAELYMTWKEGRLTTAEIHADSDYDADVICGEKRIHITLGAGQSSIIM